jgi:hypothetical protein
MVNGGWWMVVMDGTRHVRMVPVDEVTSRTELAQAQFRVMLFTNSKLKLITNLELSIYLAL